MLGRRLRTARETRTLAITPSRGVLRLLPSDVVTVRPRAYVGPRPPRGFLGGEHAVAIRSNPCTIGRGLHNSVVLVDPAVSREHARLGLDDDGWWLENVSAHNPALVNDALVAPGERVTVAPGDRMLLGGSAIELVAPPGESLDDLGGESYPAYGMAATPNDSSSTHLLNPGITLQFALAGARSPLTWWAVAVAGLLVFASCAVVTLGAAALIGRDALALGGPRAVLAALTIPLVPALGVTLLVAALDRYEREPWFLLAAAFLWGAVIAVPPVLFVEHAVSGGALSGIGPDSPLGIVARALSAGVIEEGFKGAGLVVLLLTLRDEFDNVTDGILYGLLIGAGFAMVENYVYFALSSPTDLPLLILGRIVLGWLGHSTFTALLGAGLGYAREAHRGGRRWRWPLVGFAAAIALHTLFDGAVYAADAVARTPTFYAHPVAWSVGSLVAVYLPLAVAEAALLTVVLRSLRREAEVVREYLASEVRECVITPDEYLLVQNATLRNAVEHRLLLTGGPRMYLTVRTLHQTATGLAFRKWHVAMGDPAKTTTRQPEEAYRERIVRLRRSLVRQMERSSARTAALALR